MADPVISPPEVAFTSPLEHSRRQLEALLEVSEAIAQQRDLPALFHDLSDRLRSVIEFDFLTLVLHDPARNVMRLHVLATRIHGEKAAGSESPVEGNPAGWVWQTQQPFVVSDTDEETRFPDFLKRYREHNVRSLAILPLTTAQHRLGAMGFGRLLPQRITDTELQFMERVASQVAVAVDNAINFATSQAYQSQLARQRDRLQVLLEINNLLITSRELPELFRGIVNTLERVIHHDYTSLALLDSQTGLLKIHALDFPGNQNIFKPETLVPRDTSPAGRAIATSQPLIARGSELDRYDTEIIRTLRAEGLQAVCCIPLIHHGHTFGTLNLASRRLDFFTPEDVELLQPVAAQIAIAVENALAFKEIEALKKSFTWRKKFAVNSILRRSSARVPRSSVPWLRWSSPRPPAPASSSSAKPAPARSSSPAPSTISARVTIAPSLKSIVPPFPAAFSNPSFSAMSAAHSPAPSIKKSAASNSPTAAPSSSTKSATFPSNFSRNFFACCKSRNSNGSAATARSA